MPYFAPTVETIDTGVDYHHVARNTGVLSTGHVVTMVQDRNELFAKLQLYSTDGSTVSSEVDQTISFVSETRVPYSFVVDASDNIHVAYVTGGNQVTYLRLDKGVGLTWTVGVNNEAAFNPGTTIWKVDIALLDDPDSVIIAALRGSGSAATLRYAVRKTDGTWATSVSHTLDNARAGSGAGTGSSTGYEYGYISIAEDIDGATSNEQNVLIAVCPANQTKHAIYGLKVNISTGAEVTWKTMDSNAFSAAGSSAYSYYQQATLFSTAPDQWTIGAITGNGSSARAFAGRLSWAGYTVNLAMQSLEVQTSNQGPTQHSKARAINYVDGRIIVNYSIAFLGWFVKTRFAIFSGSTVQWGPSSDSAYVGLNVLRDMYGGNNRNFDKKLNAYNLQAWNDGTTTASRYIIFNQLPITPGALSKPADGSMVNTDQPLIGITVQTGTFAPRNKPKAYFATDSGFSTNLKTHVFPDSKYAISGTYVEDTLAAFSELFQGTWYGRIAYVDEYGWEGAAGPTNDFTVSHPPTTSGWSPIGGQIVQRLTGAGNRFSWVFNDTSPSDAQTAYQVVIEKNSDGSAVADTGKVTSTNKYADVLIPTGNVGEMLRWKVRVWDSDDVAGPYSEYSLAQFNNPPSVVDTVSNYTTPSPNITWTYTAGTAGAQTAYRVILWNAGEAFLAAPVYDSGLVASSAASHQVPLTAHPLIRNQNYDLAIFVYDAAGMSGSTSDLNRLATWTAPPQPSFTVDIAQFAATGVVVVNWDDNNEDANFDVYRVYRRLDGETAWTLVEERAISVATMSAVDIYAVAQMPNEYMVTQVKLLGGIQVESDFTTVVEVTPLTDGYHITDPALQGLEYTDLTATALINFRIEHITEDSFRDEIEEAVMNIVGRGRHLDLGTNFGVNGTITAQLRGLGLVYTAHEERMVLQQLREEGKRLIMKTPFGDVWALFFGQLEFERIAGVGTSDFTDVTIPYAELKQ